MRILIISFFYHPEPNDIKIHSLARALTERGHHVRTITTFPNYPDGEIYPGYRQKWREWQNLDGVQVLRVPLYADHSRSGAKRILSYVSFMLSASLIGPWLSGPADVIWVYHPPLTTAVAGWWLSLTQLLRGRRTRFVLEIQDMWPETLAATGMFSNPTGLKAVGAVAKFLYGRSAALTVNSPGMHANLITKGVPAEKIQVMPNWADESIYMPTERDAATGQLHGLTDKFNVIFAGNIGTVQSLHTIIDAAAHLLDQPEIQFVLIGDGVELPALKAAVAARDLPNVRFIDRHPASAMPGFFAWADALLISLKDDPLYRITIPAKTQSYLASGRPIIAALAGDGADVIQQADAGVTCAPGDASALAKAVMSLYTMPRAERERLGSNGRAAYTAHYSQAQIVQHYEGLFQRIAVRR